MESIFKKIDVTEFNKAEDMLKERGIPYEREDDSHDLPNGMGVCERHQVLLFDENGNTIADFVCSTGTYGADHGLLEYWGDRHSDPEGWLTADEVLQRIETLV